MGKYWFYFLATWHDPDGVDQNYGGAICQDSGSSELAETAARVIVQREYGAVGEIKVVSRRMSVDEAAEWVQPRR